MPIDPILAELQGLRDALLADGDPATLSKHMDALAHRGYVLPPGFMTRPRAALNRMRTAVEWLFSKPRNLDIVEAAIRERVEALGAADAAADEAPTDLMPMGEALKRFHVSRSTLQRCVVDGHLPSYRLPHAGKTASHVFSEADLAARFTRWPT